MSCFSCCNSNVEGTSSIKKSRLGFYSTGKGCMPIHTALSLKTGSSRRRTIESELRRIGQAKNDVKTFTFAEVSAATDDFNHKCLIGEGGFGLVFKGYLKSIDREVAVKQLNREGTQGSREFFQEVLMLSLVQHPNLVNLIGYCVDDHHRILVYEYMENGCLENHLLDLGADKVPLSWLTRMKIAKGAAHGLEYLHDTSDPPIIYRDFRASNILLDEEFNPKLSDFGLAKIGPTEGDDYVCSRVMGTYGYCAPEYVSTGKLTTKSDVYSFGVVFLELITGRRAIDKSRTTEEQNLIDWAQPLLQDRRKFPQMADPLLEGKYHEKGLFKALAIAAMCLQEDPEPRPSMAEVVTALELLCDEPSEDESYDGENVELVKATSNKDSREA